MSELDRPGEADIGARDFETMVDRWPDRVTVRRLLERAGRRDVLTIVSEERIPSPQPKFTPREELRATASFPAVS